MESIWIYIKQHWFPLILFAGICYAIYWVCTHRDELMIYHDKQKGNDDSPS
ncbi:hypothetical protein [Paenibacillus sp. J2TS4]|uniref:hypothetical protein n=1 Tax=Paenibacillus sp. J2TS4 TaxID=2807194 RepID=UPI001B17CBB2|nr:hypothetical protein [Paenibacillus sp. J2TS4]GIP34551.1 hypothetical protein J2TS4_37610 [Paenibacillus sp. J2TS4]